MLELRTFGGLSLKDDGASISGAATQHKTLALLALLAAASKNGLSRDKLIAYLWPESDAEHGRNLLKQACYALRRDLQAPDLFVGATALRLNPDIITSDVQSFDDALERGDAAQTVALYTGPFLDGFFLNGTGEFERWVATERARLKQCACQALEALASVATARGDQNASVAWWRRLTELDPLSSRAALGLMTALETAGERAKAIGHGRAHETFVRAELSAEPASEVLALIERLHNETANNGRVRRVAPQATPGGEVVETTSPTAVTVPPTLLRRLRRADVLSRIAVAAVGVLLAGGVAGYALWPHQPAAGGADVPADRKMLVVLPFENLGSPRDEYFADGLSEAITTRLASIRRLGVIAGQSAMQYKRTTKAPTAIGKELGVEYILAGTVRWEKRRGEAGRVRVSSTLVRASDALQLWAEQYDTVLAGVFAVQSLVAEHVARALDIVLIEPERRGLAARPTDNLQAYDAYLRGWELRTRGYDAADWKRAADMFARAATLDPTFGPAYAELAQADLVIYIDYIDRSEARLAQSRTALDRALRLDPDLPEAHVALGDYYSWIRWDRARALEEFHRVQRAQPNNVRVLDALGDVARRQGRWAESVAYYRKALEFNPRGANVWNALGDVYIELRRYPEGIEAYDRALDIARTADSRFTKALAYLSQTGDLEPTQQMLPDVSENMAATGVPVLVVTLADVVTLLTPAQRAKLLAISPRALDGDTAGWALARAMVYRAQHELPLARAYFDSARIALESKLARDQDEYGRLRCMLGVALAGLGRSAEAVREGRSAVQALPVSKDAVEGPLMIASLARIYVMTGNYDAAVEQLELLLSRPGPLSGGWLRADPFWDPLRSHPGFQRLANKSS